MERLLPPRRDRPISFNLPIIASLSDISPALSAVLEAMAHGQISVSEAVAVTNLVEGYRRIVEASSPSSVEVQVRFGN